MNIKNVTNFFDYCLLFVLREHICKFWFHHCCQILLISSWCGHRSFRPDCNKFVFVLAATVSDHSSDFHFLNKGYLCSCPSNKTPLFKQTFHTENLPFGECNCRSSGWQQPVVGREQDLLVIAKNILAGRPAASQTVDGLPAFIGLAAQMQRSLQIMIWKWLLQGK